VAVSPDRTTPQTDRGREVPFVLDTRWTVVYRIARRTVRIVLKLWFRPLVIGRENIPDAGPVVLAPVHRSFADFVFAAAVTERKLFFMGKASLWRSRVLGKVLVTVGAFPVHRGSADREALQRAQQVLEQGQVLVMFPEGTRQQGAEVQPLLDGVAFLAARTGAAMVPIGIGGSDLSMPLGSKFPRPRRISVVVGEPLAPPRRASSGRVPRSAVHERTAALRGAIQAAYDRALRLVD
jgi:1-acyl-sn-glycerol-3-phosphate acyltransferase